MKFHESYQKFIYYQKSTRQGRNLLHLKESHGHAEIKFLENVWWPAFGNFDHLFPEYEVCDFKEGTRFLDFAFIRPPLRMCIEIDGYGPHWQNMSRLQFSDDRMRQNHLVIDGWMVLRFSYDDINERPRQCQQTIQQMVGRSIGSKYDLFELNLHEQEIVRFAMRTNGVITLQQICSHLSTSEKTTRKILKTMVGKTALRPAGGTQRIHSYELNPEHISKFF